MATSRKKIRSCLRVENLYVREFMAEFLAVFVLISLGCGSNAQVILSHHTYGGYLSTNLGWGLAVATATWVSFRVSGAHLNPAVTFAMWVVRKKNLKQLIIYSLAQYISAFVASACVYGIYYDALNNFDGGTRVILGENGTAGIWATYPQPYLGTLAAFGDQVFTTMLLLLCALGVTDMYNMWPEFGMIPFCIGAIVALIGMTYSMNSGAGMNPARDFSPRLFTAIAGWGTDVFTVCDYFFWIPLVAPHIGALCGMFLYLTFVGIHVRPLEDTSDPESQLETLTPKEISLPMNEERELVEEHSSTVENRKNTIKSRTEHLP